MVKMRKIRIILPMLGMKMMMIMMMEINNEMALLWCDIRQDYVRNGRC
jgi:hypothetical protein